MKKETSDCAIMHDTRFKALNMENIELAREFLISLRLEEEPKKASLWIDNILTPPFPISEFQKLKKILKSFSHSKKYKEVEVELFGCILISQICFNNLQLLRLDITYTPEIDFSVDYDIEEVLTTFLTREECGYVAESLMRRLKNL